MAGVIADRAVGQPRRGPRQHEPGQHAGLEAGQFLRARRHPMLTQVTHQRQSHPITPRLHPRRQAISLGEIISRSLKEDQDDPPATGQLHKSWSRPDRGWQESIDKLTNSGTVAYPTQLRGRVLITLQLNRTVPAEGCRVRIQAANEMATFR
jgi:hypothetical protein